MPKTILLILLLAPLASAQVPLALEERSIEPYTTNAFENGRYTVTLDAGEYFLVYDNTGLRDAEYWIRDSNGQLLTSGKFCCDGGTAFTAAGGDYVIELNSQGAFTVVDRVLIDTSNHVNTTITRQSAPRSGYAMHRDAPQSTTCITATSDFTYKVMDTHFQEVARGEFNARNASFTLPLPDLFYVMYIDGGGTVNVTMTTTTCLEESIPAAREGNAPNLDSPNLNFVIVVAALAALALKRQPR